MVRADAVLFLPGMMCDQRLFSPQIQSLSIPWSVADTSSHDSFAEMASAALAAAPDRFAVVGLSMGGILAFEIWRQAPERVSHMALMDTNPHADAPERQDLRLEQIRRVANGDLREVVVDGLKPLYLAARHRDDEKLLGVALDMAMDLGSAVFRRQSIALKDRVDSVPHLQSISCPATVLCGDEDTLCPPELHQLMADSIPGAELCIVPECGHLATLEQPEKVNDALHRLLCQPPGEVNATQ